MSQSSTYSRLRSLLLILPSGSIPVGLGLVVGSLTAYFFQVFAFRSLGPAPYAALNGLWVLTFVLVPVFQPLEQELTRAVAHRTTNGLGAWPVIMKAGLIGLGGLSLVEIVLFLLRETIEERFLRGNSELLVCLCIALAIYAAATLTRGVLAGTNNFGAYGAAMGVEGISRLVLAAGAVFIGIGTLGWFGLAFAAAPVFALIVGVVGARPACVGGPPAEFRDVSVALGWLVIASAFGQAMGYSAYLGASFLATPAQDAALGGFVVALFVARLPTMAFQAIQAALLTKLSGLLARGQYGDFRQGMNRLLLLVSALAAIGVLFAATLGPIVGRLLFGAKFSVSAGELSLLTLGSGFVLIALTLMQALIAVRRYPMAALAWVVGTCLFVVAMLFPLELFLRAELAFALGAALSAAVMLFGTVRALKAL